MEYIKIPIICADAILALGEAECGRLLMSLLEYSRGGGTVEPRGAEKSIYLILKAQMDKDTETGRKRAENGRKGGIAKSSKLKQNLASDSMLPSPLPSPPTPPISIPPSPKEKPPTGGKKKVPPTVEEVRAYCQERGNGIDPEAFVDFYAARGWKYGAGRPIVDWKAAVRTWEARRRAEQPATTETYRPRAYHLERDEDGQEVVVYDD